jgi:putative membrane protein
VVLGGFIGGVVLLSLLLAFAVPVLIVWLIIVIVRNAADGGSRRRREDRAVAELRWRYARGEISQEEFERRMWDLGYEKVP